LFIVLRRRLSGRRPHRIRHDRLRRCRSLQNLAAESCTIFF
jgi:hypothetical protein